MGDVQTTLSIRNPGPGPYNWSITTGADKASFANGGANATSTTSSASVTVYALSYSTSPKDVTVSVTDSAGGSGNIQVQVDSPYRLTGGIVTRPEGVANCPDPIPLTYPPGQNGWHAKYTWYMLSKFNRALNGISLNENFSQITSSQTNNLSFTPNGSPGIAGVNYFSDNYCLANPYGVVKPPPTIPQKPLGNNLIDSATQTYKVGTDMVGYGVDVQSQTLSRYVDHPALTDVKSPVRSN